MQLKYIKSELYNWLDSIQHLDRVLGRSLAFLFFPIRFI